MVRVKGEGGMFEARSDAEGIYEFYDIPSGKYEFAPDLPEGTTLSWYIGSNRPLGAFDFEGGCKEEDIDVFASGSIQGRVLDSLNNVLPHAFVYIVPVDIEEIPKASQLYWANQDKEGAFKFVHIPPGDYVILVIRTMRRIPNSLTVGHFIRPFMIEIRQRSFPSARASKLGTQTFMSRNNSHHAI